MKIGFIGAGRMAQALGTGICRKISGARFTICDPSSDACHRFSSLVGRDLTQIVNDNGQVLRDSEIAFIAVKPQMIEQALSGLGAADVDWPLVISVAAGISLQRLTQMLGSNRITRVMPNTPCLIGKGISAFAPDPGVSAADISTVKLLLNTVGQVVQVPESQLDAVTGLSGSGPAFVYTFIESLISAGISAGLEKKIATQLTVQTVLGAAAMVAETGETAAALRQQVTSPGGTTLS